MYNSKYISIKEIAERIKRGRLFKDLSFESIVIYAVDAMKLILSEKYYVTLPAVIEIKSYKAALPCGFEYMLSCNKYENEIFIPMSEGTDNFHNVYDKIGLPTIISYTYTLNNSVIFTNFQEGDLFIVYKAIPVDKDGYPMIPDNVNVELAVSNYIKYNYLEDMAPDDNISKAALNKAEQEYCWYVGKAKAESTNMTMDEMETFANSMSRLFTNPYEFEQRMQYLGKQEILKIK